MYKLCTPLYAEKPPATGINENNIINKFCQYNFKNNLIFIAIFKKVLYNKYKLFQTKNLYVKRRAYYE